MNYSYCLCGFMYWIEMYILGFYCTFYIYLELELAADLKRQDHEAIKRSSAYLILKLKERCKLSQLLSTL